MGRVFSFSTLLTEKWEWMEVMGWSLMFSGTHHTDRAPPSAALLALLTLQMSERLLPVRQEGCLGEEVHFFILIAQSSGKKPSPLIPVEHTCLHMCKGWVFWCLYTELIINKELFPQSAFLPQRALVWKRVK